MKILPSSLSKKLSRRYLYESVGAHLTLVAPGSRALCIGSSGSITNILKKYSDENCVRLDLLDNDPSRNPDIIADICKDPLQAKIYDVVFMYEVLEHLYDPFSAINNIYYSLKPGGLLVGSTPFAMPIHEAPHDFYRYTEFGLKYILRDFASIRIDARGNYYEAIDVAWARSIHCSTSNTKNFISEFLVLMVYFIKQPISRLLFFVNPLGGWHIGYVFSGYKDLPSESPPCV